MEKVPSPHLFKVFSPVSILRVLGVSCNKDRPPFAISCPKCRKSCWVHGVSPFGGWLNCTHCGLTGDPIRVYQQTYRIKTLETTINHLIKEVKGPAPRQTDLDLYEVFHYNYYNKVERFWETCKHRAANENQPFHAQRLYELGLWKDSYHFNKYFKETVGYTTKYDIQEILGGEVKELAPLKHFTRSVIFPFEMVPGLKIGFCLLGRKDRLFFFKVTPDHYGGFFNLPTDGAKHSNTTLIVDNPLQVLHVTLRQGMEGCKFPHVMCPFESRQLDFHLFNMPLLYWGENPEPENLRKLFLYPNIKVCELPSPPTWANEKDKLNKWCKSLLPTTAKRIKAGKWKPIPKYCVDAILKSSCGAAAYLDRLSATSGMVRAMMGVCPKSKRKKLGTLLDDIDYSDSIILSGKLVYEKGGKWWCRPASKRQSDTDELISEAILVLDDVYKTDKNLETSYAGRFRCGDVSVAFTVDAKELNRNPRHYIEMLCAHAGVATMPFISDWGNRRMIEIAKLFNPPEVTLVARNVGYDEMTKQFYLPHILLTPSGIRAGGNYVVPKPNLPGENISITERLSLDHLKSWTGKSYECAGYWATLIAMIYSVYSRAIGTNTTGICLVGGKGSLAEQLFHTFRFDFDLLKADLTKLSQNKIAHVSQEHGLPLAIDGLRCHKRRLQRWITASSTPNTLLLCDEMQAAALGLDPDWTFVRAPAKVMGETKDLAGTEDFVAHALQCMAIGEPDTLSEASLLCSHMLKEVEMGGSGVIDRAYTMLAKGSVLNTGSDVACFIYLASRFIYEGIIEVSDWEDRFLKHPITVVTGSDMMYINLSKFRQILKKENLKYNPWRIAKSLNTLGFYGCSEELEVYRGPYSTWQKLTLKLNRLVRKQSIRDQGLSQ